jgi:hydrogenase maturation protease
MPSVVVIGVGNPDRGDDGAGREVARRLFGCGGPGVRIVEANGGSTTILDHLNGASTAYLIDACVSGAPPGTVRRIDLAEEPLPRVRYGLSSHGFGLEEALDLAQALGQLPPRCVVFAIEGENFAMGTSLSAAVTRGVTKTVEAIRREIVSA